MTILEVQGADTGIYNTKFILSLTGVLPLPLHFIVFRKPEKLDSFCFRDPTVV